MVRCYLVIGILVFSFGLFSQDNSNTPNTPVIVSQDSSQTEGASENKSPEKSGNTVKNNNQSDQKSGLDWKVIAAFVTAFIALASLGFTIYQWRKQVERNRELERARLEEQEKFKREQEEQRLETERKIEQARQLTFNYTSTTGFCHYRQCCIRHR